MARAVGLRGKSVTALLAICMVAGLLAIAVAWQAAEAMREHLGTAYTRNFTLLNRERILAPVTRELALAVRFAKSSVIRDWLRTSEDPARRSAASPINPTSSLLPAADTTTSTTTALRSARSRVSRLTLANPAISGSMPA